MKRHGGPFKAYYWMKEVNLKKLHGIPTFQKRHIPPARGNQLSPSLSRVSGGLQIFSREEKQLDNRKRLRRRARKMDPLGNETRRGNGIPLVAQRLGLRAPRPGDPGSIPGQGTRSHRPQRRHGAAKQIFKSPGSCFSLAEATLLWPLGNILSFLKARGQANKETSLPPTLWHLRMDVFSLGS